MRARINKWSHLANAGAKCGTGPNREKRNFLRYFTIMSLRGCLNHPKGLENASAPSILRVEEGLELRPSKYVADLKLLEWWPRRRRCVRVGGGLLNKRFYGEASPEVWPFTLLYTILDRKGTSIVYLFLTLRWYPFHTLVYNAASPSTAVNAPSLKYE